MRDENYYKNKKAKREGKDNVDCQHFLGQFL